MIKKIIKIFKEKIIKIFKSMLKILINDFEFENLNKLNLIILN